MIPCTRSSAPTSACLSFRGAVSRLCAITAVNCRLETMFSFASRYGRRIYMPIRSLSTPVQTPIRRCSTWKPPGCSWKTAKDFSGKMYWYHPQTKERSWVRPKEVMDEFYRAPFRACAVAVGRGEWGILGGILAKTGVVAGVIFFVGYLLFLNQKIKAAKNRGRTAIPGSGTQTPYPPSPPREVSRRYDHGFRETFHAADSFQGSKVSSLECCPLHSSS